MQLCKWFGTPDVNKKDVLTNELLVKYLHCLLTVLYTILVLLKWLSLAFVSDAEDNLHSLFYCWAFHFFTFISVVSLH